MRKCIFVLCTILASCQKTENISVISTSYQIVGRRISVYVIDSCEYIGSVNSNYSDFLSHKGNCRFCKERNKSK